MSKLKTKQNKQVKNNKKKAGKLKSQKTWEAVNWNV